MCCIAACRAQGLLPSRGPFLCHRFWLPGFMCPQCADRRTLLLSEHDKEECEVAWGAKVLVKQMEIGVVCVRREPLHGSTCDALSPRHLQQGDSQVLAQQI